MRVQLFPLLCALSTVQPTANIFAQGALTPPGPPAPLFKTLTQIEPRTPIFALPTNITQSGSYYVTSNLTGIAVSNGITVVTDDVTIDLCGFTLTGVASSGDGIHIGATATDRRTNVTVRNGTLRGWAGDGIDGGTLFSGAFHEVRAIANARNGLSAGTNGLVSRCLADNNASNGIVASMGTLVENCGARANGQDGFHVIPPGANSAGAHLANCYAQTNGANGFTVTRSTLVNCTSMNNLGHGIDCGTRSSVTGSRVMLNALDGIRAISGNFILDNNVVGNGQTAGTTNACIASYGGSANRFEGNNLANHDTGFIVTGNNCFIFKNTIQGCATNFGLLGTLSIGPTNISSGVVTNHPWANFIE